MMRKHIFAIMILMLFIALALSGCTEEKNAVDDKDEDLEDDKENDVEEDGEENGYVEQASSLRYTYTWDGPQGSGSWIYMGKNIGEQDNFKLRIEFTDDEQQTGLIVANKELRKIWTVINDEWTEIPEEYYELMLDSWVQQFETHVISLYGWTGQSVVYTDPETGTTVTLHSVEIDPNLPDSLFEP
jgi:outer membrane lipoprotein-sorting protein